MNLTNYFNIEYLMVLFKLFIAHLLADFVFQTNDMVRNKKWFSKAMGMHILLVSVFTLLITWNWALTLLATLFHWLIDGIKPKLEQRWSKYRSFVFDQVLHLFSLILIWVLYYSQIEFAYLFTTKFFQDYNILLIILGYLVVVGPIGFIIKFNLEKLGTQNNYANFENGGRLIGVFERIMILTFVLLNKYEAIGFLITGKSIIRFSQKNEDLKSEYVLLGTMMSYALSIATGVIINWMSI